MDIIGNFLRFVGHHSKEPKITNYQEALRLDSRDVLRNKFKDKDPLPDFTLSDILGAIELYCKTSKQEIDLGSFFELLKKHNDKYNINKLQSEYRFGDLQFEDINGKRIFDDMPLDPKYIPEEGYPLCTNSDEFKLMVEDGKPYFALRQNGLKDNGDVVKIFNEIGVRFKVTPLDQTHIPPFA